MMIKPHILIVEDETRIAEWIKTYGENAGYHCTIADNGRDALQVMQDAPPDVVVLDLMLPEIDGWRVAETIRRSSDVPIIMLTARISEADIIRGLKLGADDYVTKPFSPKELLARIEANLRRAQGTLTRDNDTLQAGDITLKLNTRDCLVRGDAISLTANQFNLLAFFMQHPNQVLTREQIIDHVFGMDYDSYLRAIDIHIRRLRVKIEAAPSEPAYIQTVHGVGYRFHPGE